LFDEPAGRYRLVTPERSIGRLSAFHGNAGVLVRAYTYLRTLGAEGLREMSEGAVVNANYVQARLKGAYQLPYDRPCMHEVVFSGSRQRLHGVRTLDLAKRLIDYGFHPPTVYFPLIVDEALMIEPTEAEGKESLDAFCEAMLVIAHEAETDPALLRDAPHAAPLRRLDEAMAAYEQALVIKPDYAEAILNIGDILNSRNQQNEAIEYYRRVLDSDSDNVAALVRRGTALAGLKRKDLAIIDFEKALSLDPDSIVAFNGLATSAMDEALSSDTRLDR